MKHDSKANGRFSDLMLAVLVVAALAWSVFAVALYRRTGEFDWLVPVAFGLAFAAMLLVRGERSD